MLYPPALEFLKSEVPYLRYDLREVLQLSEHLVNQNSVYRYTLDDLPISFGIFEIGGLLPPIWPPRGSAALRAPRKSKFGLQVHFRMLYPLALEFLKSEVICLRHDLREVLQLPAHLGSPNSVYRYILVCSTHHLWNFWDRRSLTSDMTSERFCSSKGN